MSADERDVLIEEAATAFRDRDDTGRVAFSPAWWDLTPNDREAAFEAHLRARSLERLVDDAGLSQTARAILARCLKLRQLRP